MRIYTVGFTRKSAAHFFEELLEPSGATRLLDVRIRNASQLSGFAKAGKSGGDLAFFLRRICAMDYAHLPELAPTAELLDDYRKGRKDWSEYARAYLALLDERQVADSLDRDLIADSVLLCSEHDPDQCHRRLAAEYLQRHWGGIEIVHLR